MSDSLGPAGSAQRANHEALILRAQGKLGEAIAVLRAEIARSRGVAQLHHNLGQLLEESSDLAGACGAYDAALGLDPTFLPSLLARAACYARQQAWDDAAGAYTRVLEVDPTSLQAHLALYEIEQIRGHADRAVEHQRHALTQQRLYSRRAPQERRRVLGLLAPGDWKANAPLELILPPEQTTLHRLYVVGDEPQVKLDLPPVDVAFVAIGESPAAVRPLRTAARVLRSLAIPAINEPRFVLRTNRMRLPRFLASIPNCVVAPIALATRAMLLEGNMNMPFPVIVRPIGSHAGEGLERIDDARALADYAARMPQGTYYVSTFIDYRSADGYYRKYRVILIDGRPYPFHLAVSPNWMVHYYNSPMREQAWMREEEARYLEGGGECNSAPILATLRLIAKRLRLDYIGVDCAIDRDGRLVVFEADPAIIVHLLDDPQLFGYKRGAIKNIFSAIESMLDERAQTAAGN